MFNMKHKYFTSKINNLLTRRSKSPFCHKLLTSDTLKVIPIKVTEPLMPYSKSIKLASNNQDVISMVKNKKEIDINNILHVK